MENENLDIVGEFYLVIQSRISALKLYSLNMFILFYIRGWKYDIATCLLHYQLQKSL